MNYPKSPFVRNPRVESQLIKGNNASIAELLQWLCLPPTVTTYRVNLLKTTVKAFKLRVQNLLTDYGNPSAIYEIPQIPEVVCIAGTQTEPPKVDNTLKEVIVDGSCGAALLRGAHIYAPGVLAMQSGCKQNEKVLVFADLAGKCKKGTNIRFESEEKLFLGVGVTCMQRYQLFSDTPSAGIAVQMLSTICGVPSLGDLSGRDALLQNLPSIVCVRVLNPQPGEHVLDMCAAPGNKLTHIAEMMRDKGVIVALDKTERKINCLKEKIVQNELRSVKAFTFDATKAYEENGHDTIGIDWSPPFVGNSFDRILLDAPCSALGNRPVLVSRMQPKMLQSYPHVQRKLLASAVQLLKPQGVLVYSTCTVTEDENESMVAWMLEKYPHMQLVDALPKFGGPGLPDVGLTEEERKLVQRFGPPSTNANSNIDTIGFFIAKFIKLH